MKRYSLIFIILLLFTLVLKPYGNFVAQDDAVYADSVSKLIESGLKSSTHPLTLAAFWPQAILGASSFFITGNLLPTLTFLTWLIFCAIIFSYYSYFKNYHTLILSFFLFPIWVQYGASFLSDIYAALFLAIFLFSIQYKKISIGFSLLMFTSIVLVTLQRQTLIIYPFSLALCFLINSHNRNIKLSMYLTFSSITSLIIYSLLPKSPLQDLILDFKIKSFFEHLLPNLLNLGANFTQFLLALGLFLIPFLDLKKLNVKKIVAITSLQILSTFILFISATHILAAGVLFTDYIPRIISAFFLSFGVWGLVPILEVFLKDYRNAFFVMNLISTLVQALFYALMNFVDIRYMMLSALAWAWYFLQHSKVGARPLGNSLVYLLIISSISLFTNKYNLKTVEVRWNLAREIKSQHQVPSTLISAGYGYDLFHLGRLCSEELFKKIETLASSTEEKNNLIQNRFISIMPRIYEDQWEPLYIIKPSQFLFKKLNLKTLKGSLTPEDEVRYHVFGLPFKVAIYKNVNYTDAYCFKAL